MKFKVYTSDLMIKYVEKLEAMLEEKGVEVAAKGENDPAHDQKSEMSRSKTVLDNISAQEFTQRTGLPPSYQKTIAAFENIFEERNTVCHETGFEFARLLLTRQFKDPVMAKKFNCEHWSALLLWVTGYATLEEMAAAANAIANTPTPIQ